MTDREPPVETEFGKRLKAPRNPVGIPIRQCGFMWVKHTAHLNDEAPPDTTWCPGNLKDGP